MKKSTYIRTFASVLAIILSALTILSSCTFGTQPQPGTSEAQENTSASLPGTESTSVEISIADDSGATEPSTDVTDPATETATDTTQETENTEPGTELTEETVNTPEDTTSEPPSEDTTAEITDTTSEQTSEELTTEETTAEETTAAETQHVHLFGGWTTVRAAACETTGLEKRTCDCGVSETRTIKATGHTKVYDWNTPATCLNSGISTGSHCSVCGKVIEPQEVIPALGHSFGTNNKCVRCGLLDPDLGTLLYYENFESYSASTNSSTVLSRLGWKIDSPANGAYRGSTTSYSIKSTTSGKQLYLTNNTSSGTDSYCIVLPASLMGEYHESNYTYQYDITYDSASAADRYIALVSDYNGPTYNSFHFRNRGTANNQVHTNGSWYTYDAKGVNYAANTDSNSIVYKLLGKTYSESAQAFKGVSVSIRYVVDWENGNSVYMRVNTAGYPGTGKWTLVSKYSSSGNAGAYLDFTKFGGAIVLKTGGKQNGYIDNITVWTGTGDEPYDKSSPLFKSSDPGCSGHRFSGGGTCLDPEKCIYCGELSANNAPHAFVHVGTEANTDRVCSVCHVLESNVGSTWYIEEIPAFDGGTRSAAVYRAGQGPYDSNIPLSAESEMMIISSAGEAALGTYLTKLQTYGYTEEYSAARDGNVYAGYSDGTYRIYAYYTANNGQIRVILDRNGESVNGFGYTYEKQQGERTIVYQYGVPMNSTGASIDSSTEKKINCGMMYVIKLADGKLLIIDGGGYQQFDDAECAGLMSFMREVTGRESGKIDIAGWYITHCHSDHLAGFCLFLGKYGANLNIERLIFNFPSTMTEDGVLSGLKSNYQKLIGYIQNYAPSASYLKIHTGQSVTLCDLTINCIYTHEDLVNASTGLTEIASDFNNSTTVSRLDFDGLRFMLLGDVNKPGMNVIIAQNSAQTLKSDIVQLAHHVYNDLRTLYNIVKAEAVFAPQSIKGAYKNATMKAIMTTAESYVTDKTNLLKFGGSGTYGYAAGEDGRPALVYAREGVDGGEYTGWSW